MIHRDLKIGLVLGLILVIGIVIKLATNPDLSPEARMEQNSTRIDNQNSSDTNNMSLNYVLSDISLDSSQPGNIPAGRTTQEYLIQEDQLKNPFSSNQLSSQSKKNGLEQQETSFNEKATEENITQNKITAENSVSPEESQNIASRVHEEIPNVTESVSARREQSESPGDFDYENTKTIKTERFHIVGKNETLSDISRLYYHSANQWQKIVDANPEIKNPNKIKTGMKLIIPWQDK